MSETPEQMHNRLIAAMAAARFEPLPQPYAWQRLDTLLTLPSGALASVRDGLTWHTLVPVSPEAAGAYRILVFHFAEGTNASGFVAWLAGLVKTEIGTGAMVVCGFDARATPALWQTSLGLFDYWGFPWACGEDVIALVERLRRAGTK